MAHSELTEKRVNDRPVTWHVHYAGVRVDECLLLMEERKSGLRDPISVFVKVFGCRPCGTMSR
jgi:hypothetical protein